MPLVQTRGAASAQGFGEFAQAAVAANYIEDVFSTFLYTGNGSTQTITNGIDLSTKGGLVWIKSRTTTFYHNLVDTVRGVNNRLFTNTTDAQTSTANSLTAFNTNGFSLGTAGGLNVSADLNVSWSFRKQPKFFDVVTYTGTASAQNIAHNLGSTPACIIVKKTSDTSIWPVYHSSLGGADKFLLLNATDAVDSAASLWNNTAPTSTQFTVGTSGSTNGSGNTFVAYLFASNAGGFGLTGTDNVISCGSFTTDAGGSFSVNLGYEPQWMMIKCSSNAQDWQMFDNMRGLVTQPTAATARLIPNTSAVENSATNDLGPTSTGFESIGNYGASRTYVYIAIRRGPMKVPTSGTSVFAPVSRSGTYTVTPITAGFAPDLIVAQASNLAYGAAWWDRLRGKFIQLRSYTTAAEMSSTDSVLSFDNTGVTVGLDGNEWINGVSSGNIYANWMFRRAPSFFDEVCYTGTGSNLTLNHNLGAVPELMIVKRRDSTTAGAWFVYTSFIGNGGYVNLNYTTAVDYWINIWNDTTPTSTQFTVGSYLSQSGGTHVAYLFATCAGVSKVGSYTGTATTKQIDCGFAAGARFILIKRTDSTGDWYVWDTARGIVSGNDPYLLLNTQSAQVTSTDYIDTYSAGFEISSTAPAAINASGGTYIFLAIA